MTTPSLTPEERRQVEEIRGRHAPQEARRVRGQQADRQRLAHADRGALLALIDRLTPATLGVTQVPSDGGAVDVRCMAGKHAECPKYKCHCDCHRAERDPTPATPGPNQGRDPTPTTEGAGTCRDPACTLDPDHLEACPCEPLAALVPAEAQDADKGKRR